MACEMHISDWSSDVCASDLRAAGRSVCPGRDRRRSRPLPAGTSSLLVDHGSRNCATWGRKKLVPTRPCCVSPLEAASMMPSLMVMGVSGTGKSSVATALAAGLHPGFVGGDDQHPRAHHEKMSAGKNGMAHTCTRGTIRHTP